MANNVRDLFLRWGAARALLFGAIGIGFLVLMLAVSRWASAPRWVPLLQGQPLETTGSVTASLDESGIAYRLEQGGAVVTVNEPDLARARVLLAQQGLPAAGDPGFELFDRPSWGMTDFTQRINYRRALEGELERSIGAMQGVASARVHLGISERAGARRAATNNTASVVLQLRPGGRTGAELVDAVASLVASSVDGLTSDHVTVLDDAGRLLSTALEPGSADGGRKRELALRRDVEGYLEARAEELVTQVFGAGNVRVRVAAEFSFERRDRTVQTVDPEQTVATSEEKTEVVPLAGQAGGTSATTATYDVSRQVETTSSAGGEIRRLTVAVLLNSGAEQPVDAGGVEAVVANAVGFDRARGDSIAVMAVAFAPVAAPPAPEPPTVDVGGWIELLRPPVLGALGLLLTFILGLKVLQLVRSALRPAASAQLPPPALHVALPAPAAAEPLLSASSQPLMQSTLQPELAARVLRAWARE